MKYIDWITAKGYITRKITTLICGANQPQEFNYYGIFIGNLGIRPPWLTCDEERPPWVFAKTPSIKRVMYEGNDFYDSIWLGVSIRMNYKYDKDINEHIKNMRTAGCLIEVFSDNITIKCPAFHYIEVIQLRDNKGLAIHLCKKTILI